MDSSDNYAITWAACWSHARRKFENAQSTDEKFRASILKNIRHLFMYERVAHQMSEIERLKLREEKEKPIVDKIFQMLREKVKDNILLPKSAIAEAIRIYVRKREKL